jgi:hypothetical protein
MIQGLRNQLDALKVSGGEALTPLNESTKAVTLNIEGGADALKAMGEAMDTAGPKLITAFTGITAKLEDMIARLSTVGALTAQLAGGVGVATVADMPDLSGVPKLTTPGEFLGPADNTDISGDIQPATNVNVNAGIIVGNPDDLANMMLDSLEGGGDVASRYRSVTDQFSDS